MCSSSIVVFVVGVRREPDKPPLDLIDARLLDCAPAVVVVCVVIVVVLRREPDEPPLDLIDARLLGCAAAAIIVLVAVV